MSKQTKMVELLLSKVQEMRDEMAGCLAARTEALVRNIELEADNAALRQSVDTMTNAFVERGDEIDALRQQLVAAGKREALAIELRLRILHASGVNGVFDEAMWFTEAWDDLSRDTGSKECPFCGMKSWNPVNGYPGRFRCHSCGKWDVSDTISEFDEEHSICPECGFNTYHVKDGEMQHEHGCPREFADTGSEKGKPGPVRCGRCRHLARDHLDNGIGVCSWLECSCHEFTFDDSPNAG